MIPVGYNDIPPGHLAAVVTYLEMRERPAARPVPPQPGLRLARLERPGLAEFRALFRAIGEDFIWSSRLEMSDAELASVIENPDLHVHAVVADAQNSDDRAHPTDHHAHPAGSHGRLVGLMELDFRNPPECELSFFGLAPSHVGKGTGRWLMDQAIARAFVRPISRFFVHTCTLDHPAALPFYMRSGFTAYKRQVEVLADPRLTGVLARTAAPQVPLIEG